MTNVIKSYEKVETDEKENEDEKPPLNYGYGFRHVQCIIYFLSLTVLFIARFHLSVTIVAMTDVPNPMNNILGSENELLINSLHLGKNIIGILPINETQLFVPDNLKATNDEANNTNKMSLNINDVLNDTRNNLLKDNTTDDLKKSGNETSQWNIYRTYPWPKSTQEMVLGAFFLGYMLMMSPMGMLAQRFGGKLPLQIGLFASAIISFLTPWLAVWGNYTAVCLSRVAMGLAQAGTYPSVLTLIAKWVPVGERGRLATYVYLGSHVGSILSYHVSGFLVASTFGWPSVFWVSGVLCMIMAVVLTMFGASSPQQHRFINQAESNYIIGSEEEHVEKRLPTPWKAILTSRAAWMTFIAHIGGYNYALFLNNQIPTYMHFIVGFNIKSSGLLSSLPYIANLIFSTTIGNLADYVLNRKILTLKQVRIISNHIANVCPAIGLFAVSFISSPTAVVVVLIMCMGTYGATHTAWMVNYIDLSPNFSSTLMATGNTLANLTGLLWPTMISFIVTDVTNVYQWRIMLFVVGMLALVCNAIFVTFMSADIQPWNDCHDNSQADTDVEDKLAEKNQEQT